MREGDADKDGSERSRKATGKKEQGAREGERE